MRHGALVLVIALTIGCDKTRVTVNYDADDARETLVTALRAWKQQRANQLAKRQPPIRFVDDDWQSGWQLMDFQLGESAALFGPFRDVPVTVTLRHPSGRTIGKRITYQVTLKPTLAVLRSD